MAMNDVRDKSQEGTMPPARFAGAPKLTFGIYPGGALGTGAGILSGRPNDPERIIDMIGRLQADTKPFIVRCYLHYMDSTPDWIGRSSWPKDFLQYAGDGRKIDLVLSYTSKSGNVAGWVEFVREAVRRYGPKVAMLQVAEEPNLTISPVIDGSFPNVREALVQGVIAARDEAKHSEIHGLQIGFSAVPNFEADDFNNEFWKAIGALGGAKFAKSVDYFELDIFPDVFFPLAPLGLTGEIPHFVEMALRSMSLSLRLMYTAC